MRPVKALAGLLAALTLTGCAGLAAAEQRPDEGCSAGLTAYRQAADEPDRLRAALAPYYEIGIENQVFGPGPGLAAPWADVRSWAAAHPAKGVAACLREQGWIFAALDVRGGHAYVQLTPDGQVAKLYVSTRPIAWD